GRARDGDGVGAEQVPHDEVAAARLARGQRLQGERPHAARRCFGEACLQRGEQPYDGLFPPHNVPSDRPGRDDGDESSSDEPHQEEDGRHAHIVVGRPRGRGADAVSVLDPFAAFDNAMSFTARLSPAPYARVMSDTGTVTSLELSSATRLQRVARLQRLSEEALKRHAVRAAHERDEEALWELMEAHLTLRGLAGVATSQHTLRAYRRGLHELLVMWQGENLLRPSRDAGPLSVQRLRAGARAGVLESAPPGARRGRRVKKGPLSHATVSLRVAAGRALYDALAWAGATDADPFRDVRIGRAVT